VVETVRPGNFFTPSGQQLQHRQHGSVFPDPPQADLAGQPPTDGPVARVVHRDRAARTSQRLDHQRLRGRGRQPGAKEGDQGRTRLCRRINASRTALVTHHSNDLISCRQQGAAAITIQGMRPHNPVLWLPRGSQWTPRASTGTSTFQPL
jgi:hypothetical protein